MIVFDEDGVGNIFNNNYPWEHSLKNADVSWVGAWICSR